MRLTDLEPRWIHPNVFVFRCPHCRDVLLSCKNATMSSGDQHQLFCDTFGEKDPQIVVPCKPEMNWSITCDIAVPVGRDAVFFEHATVKPSLDASSSGHWHGNITNGEIVGGEQTP
jgi:hypothetical protein